ncbi:unnamed protein product, partial [Prorocentrum cordatum]
LVWPVPFLPRSAFEQLQPQTPAQAVEEPKGEAPRRETLRVPILLVAAHPGGQWRPRRRSRHRWPLWPLWTGAGSPSWGGAAHLPGGAAAVFCSVPLLFPEFGLRGPAVGLPAPTPSPLRVAPPAAAAHRQSRHGRRGPRLRGAAAVARAQPPRGAARAARGAPGAPAAPVLSVDHLHRPVPQDARQVLEWASAAFAAANALFFGGRLAASGGVRLDPTWHRVRGGAGGSHPGEQIIVLDPSVHTSLRALCGTLLHEMVHLEVSPSGGGPEEHGREFVSRCLDVNAAVHRANEGGLGLGCACRLGELDLSLDRALLRACGAPADCLEDEDPLRIDDEEAAGQAGSPAAWGSGLLVGDLRAAGLEDGVCASVLSGAAVATCERALGTPGGFEAWDISEATGWRIAQAQTSPSTPHPLAPPPPLLPPPLLLLLLHLSLPLPPSCVFV